MTEEDEFEWLGDSSASTPDDQATPESEDSTAPLADLADRVRDRESDPNEDLFIEADVPQVDPETVWEQLEGGEPAADGEPEHEPESRVVEKASYCETCEYFDEPPAMRCTHDGTEIRQLVDFDHVEVYNCPIVRQNDELEQS